MYYNCLFKINALICLLLLSFLPTSVYGACPAYESVQTQKYCRTSSVEPARRKEFYQNSDLSASFFTHLEKESLQKLEELQKDQEFQEIVKDLQKNSPHPQNTELNSGPEDQGILKEENLSEASLYIFVSFSMGEKALLNLANEAKRFGATLVLRGFREGSYLKTAQSLQNIIIKTGQGVIIDPELYTLFNVTAVPTFILTKPFTLNASERTQTPIHDKLQGHVTVHYALEVFAHEGDLKDEARALLRKGATK